MTVNTATGDASLRQTGSDIVPALAPHLRTAMATLACQTLAPGGLRAQQRATTPPETVMP